MDKRYKRARDWRPVAISKIKPSTDNRKLYQPPSQNRIDELAKSIEATGLLEPVILTKDGVIVSGHTRFEACKQLGHKTINAYRIRGHRKDFTDIEFVKLLPHYHNQRVKSEAEQISEKLAVTDVLKPYFHRVGSVDQEFENLEPVQYRKQMHRAKISNQKKSMVDAIMRVVEKLRAYGPTTNRAIHYQLLNFAPWFNDSKKDCRYSNINSHYQDLNNLLTRLRLCGELDWDAIGDPTRTTATYDGFQNVAEFLEQKKRTLLAGYHRDLLQTQLDHVEVIVEKNTVYSYCEPVCDQYKVPLTVAKGQSSIDCRFQICKRYRQSGKDRLICLILSDLDADGEVIAGTFQNSLEGEFGLPVECYKVGVNHSQIERFNLHDNGIEAKRTSTNYQWFAKQYGREQKSYELEAMDPEIVQQVLIEAITTVLDMDAFAIEKKKGERDRERLMDLQDGVSDFITDESKELFDDSENGDM